jgi:hypothetical protein
MAATQALGSRSVSRAAPGNGRQKDRRSTEHRSTHGRSHIIPKEKMNPGGKQKYVGWP